MFSWNDDKNQLLQEQRGVGFEEVIFHMDKGDLLDILEHPNQEMYPGQRIFVVRIRDYAYLVPFEESESEVFLRTIIPSRKATSIQSNSRCQMLHRVSRDATVGERVELWEGWHPWFRRSMASS